MSRSNKILLWVGAAAAMCGIIAAVALRSPGTPEIAGFVYPEPKILSPFELTRHDGKPFDLGALKGRWSFIYFGYTHCPDVCPTTLAELARAQKILEEAGRDAGNQYFFVSVDPRRDTLERLAEYVPYFDTKFVGVTGDRAAVAKLAQTVGVIYGFPEGMSGENYTVAHSSTVMLIDPQARLHAVFTEPQTAQGMAEGFVKILGGWS